MLIGEYNHSLDSKSRVIFPAKFREEMGERFIVTKGLDYCLNAYATEEWVKRQKRMTDLPAKARSMQRFFMSGAAEAETDSTGRILLPLPLREYAGITRDVTIIGVSDHVEIWDSERWRTECGKVTSDDIAVMMDELGF